MYQHMPTTSSAPSQVDYQMLADFQHPWQNCGQENQMPYHPMQTAPADWNSFPQYLPNNGVQIRLKNSEEWKQFDEATNEMMVVNNGRELFPKLDCSVTNLNPNGTYRTGVKLLRESRYPMKYSRLLDPVGWSENTDGSTRVPLVTNEVFGDPKYGSEMMSTGLSLEKIKIYNVGSDRKKTCRAKAPPSQQEVLKTAAFQRLQQQTMIHVHTQYRYVPILNLYEVFPNGSAQLIAAATFPETQFIVCTCYKNKKMQAMKTQKNKYVRGDVKRKGTSTSTTASSPTSSIASSSFNTTGSSSSSFDSTMSSPQQFFANWNPNYSPF